MSAESVYPWTDTRPRIYGWKAIAAELNMGTTTAWGYADPDIWTFPLPAYYSPKGWFAYADELSFWFARFKLPRGTEQALTRKTNPPRRAMNAGATRPQRTRRTKPG